jgi:hypothetical protein
MNRKTALIVGIAIASTVGLAALVPANAAAPAQGGRPTQDVRVTNTAAEAVPVAQTGTWTVGLNGTPEVKVNTAAGPVPVAAAQSGNWNVGIAGTPEVKLADVTTQVITTATRTLAPRSGAGFESIDVSKMAAIRVSARCSRDGASYTPAECGNLVLSLGDIQPNAPAAFPLAEIRLSDFDASELYELPGTSLTIGGSNQNQSGQPLQIIYKVYGRTR